MTRFTGNQIVDPGLFLSLRPFKLTSVDRRGPLPAAETTTFRRIPMLLMLALSPLLGLAFVIFLPFIGFAMRRANNKDLALLKKTLESRR